ncbi:hypothetical protein BX600DRAFT_534999 [Xylariales sp. PMI_506]|nr:hypothetical protein BX600DRAFT_534999 [Xylariales sp. PMI_506]
MDLWNPNCATGHDLSEQIPGALPLANHSFIDPSGLVISPSASTENFHHRASISEPYLDDMTELEEGKLQHIEWETNSINTPKPHDRQQAEAFMAPQTIDNRPATRRRRKTSSSSSMTSSATSSDITREKNRIAASKCRRKKKQEEQVLEERRRILQVQNAILNDSTVALRNEILTLKNEILRHGTCDFPPIQAYIQTAASQIT